VTAAVFGLVSVTVITEATPVPTVEAVKDFATVSGASTVSVALAAAPLLAFAAVTAPVEFT